MSDLFAAAPAPVVAAGTARRTTMPARFLWPWDTLLAGGQLTPGLPWVLDRVEVDGIAVVAHAGNNLMRFGPDEVVEVIAGRRP